MEWDQEKQGAREKEQEDILRDYLVHHVYPYSPFYRKRLDAAKTSPKQLGSLRDLAKLEPVTWAEVQAEPGAFLLRPTERAIARFGERKLVMAIAKAKLRGRQAQVNRDLIDPAYKPVHWHLDGDVPIGYSGEDVARLGEAGARVLALAGLVRDDVLVNVSPPAPELSYWQIVEGARSAGMSALHLSAEGAVARLDRLEAWSPTALAAAPATLAAVLEACAGAGRQLPNLHTLLPLGVVPEGELREQLTDLGRAVGRADLAVVCAWAPPGVRAQWGECRGGRGFHTYPDFEWIERSADGEILWTSLAWHGTTFLRLRTGIIAALEDGPCANCGRTGPKVVLESQRDVAPAPDRLPAAFAPPAEIEGDEEALLDEDEPEEAAEVGPEARIAGRAGLAEAGIGRLRVLDEHPAVNAWQAEFRLVDGVEELIVFVAPAPVGRIGPLFRELDATLAVTQFVVMRPEQIHERVSREGAVVDLRRAGAADERSGQRRVSQPNP